MEALKVLVTGATGYIGGSIVSTLLEAKIHERHHLSVLIRGEERAAVFQSQGVHTVLFKGLDDTEVLQRIASEHDIIIDNASGYYPSSAKAFILGLNDRKQTGGRVHYIRTSGTSNVGDQPITGEYHEVHTLTDKSNVYAYEKYRDSLHAYPQRTADLVTVETGLATGVPTTIVMAPTIYGVGSGNFNKISIQIPMLTRLAIKFGQTCMVGEGKGVWDHVHITDLTALYQLLLLKILAHEEVPTGERGVLFSGTGRFSWRELSENIAKALFELHAIKTDAVQSIVLEVATDRYGLPFPELAFASNSRTSADLARELGWKPSKTAQDFSDTFLQEAKLVVAEKGFGLR
ncbi:hypothetical protein D0Z07_8971 [Hyphodiscus hymeniophilus]|uniref:NAD-dependent epimerase/dehydratase domain-containing protein n=1 Tax=Hyphodiscus hymeniophilus TaxID=353542 RepID=A0A9P6SLI8_9HELO|nr:hypothetical protein D0Z07_8971 [Hyphodiscus hymeniophilus]